MPELHGPVPQLHDYLEHAARSYPDKVGLVCGGRRLRFSELERDASALAALLCARGVARGDRVIIFADNVCETVIAFWAVLKANAVVVIVSPLTKPDKLQYLIDDCRPVALITDVHLQRVWDEPARRGGLGAVVVAGATDAGPEPQLGFAQALEIGRSLPSPPRSNIDLDLAAIIYTSGSTGEPKGVMLTHRNMLTAATSISAYLELQATDVILNVLPLSFDYGMYQMIMAFRCGARLVLERSFAFPAQILQIAVDEAVTGLPGVPTMFAVLTGMQTLDAYNLSKLRFVTNTAAALPEKHIRALQRLFPHAKIYSMYGLTECKRCTYLPPGDLARKPTSVGLAIPNTELWIVDEHGRRLGPGEVGQLVVRGATVMQGYWEKPVASERRLKPGPLPGERVLYTGDYCKLDEEGYLYFVARMDDVIKSRGEKVAPKEVETVLLDIDGVQEVAVIGVADELLGQAIKAFVVLEAGVRLNERHIQLHCQMKLEAYMVPKHVQFVAELPRTTTGKVSKTGLQ